MKIDPQFKNLIPPLTREELTQLEENIKLHGCRDPLVHWNGTLVDGHNRFAICEKLGITFRSVPITFNDNAEAERWIIKNQLGRRNLQPFARAELALRLEPSVKLRAKENQGTRNDICQNSDRSSPVDTKREIAAIAGMSHDTIGKAKLIVEHADDETKRKLRVGEVSINRVAADIKEDLNSEAARNVDEDRVPLPVTPLCIKKIKIVFKDAPHHWMMAKIHLDKILPQDIHREEILGQIIEYCTKRINNKK